MNDEALTFTQAAKAEAEEFLELAKETLGDDYELAKEVCTQAHERKKELDAKRKYLKAPSLEAGRRIDELFMPPIRLLDEVISLGKGIIQREIERKRAEQAAALQAATTTQEIVAATKPEPKIAKTRRTMRIRVKDWTKVPPHLLLLDHRRAVEDVQAGEDISAWGEVFYDETVVM